MQEETTQKTIALAIKTSKLTASVLQKAMKMYLEHQKHKEPSHGKIPVKKPCPVCLTGDRKHRARLLRIVSRSGFRRADSDRSGFPEK